MPAKREIGTAIKLDGEEKFKSSISNINQNLRVLSSEMGAATSAYSKNGASVNDLRAKGEVLAKQLTEQKDKQKLCNEMVAAAEKAQAAAAKTAAEMAEKYGENSEEAQKAAKQLEQVNSKLAGYRIQANNATKEVNKLEAAQAANNAEIKKLDVSSFDKLKSKLKEVASEAAKAAKEIPKIAAKTITTGIEAGTKAMTAYAGALASAATAAAGLAKKAVDVGSSFESSMSQVAATMGMTAEEINNGSETFKMLEEAAKDAGATTQFSASQAADALNYLALAGYSAEDAAATLPKVLNLAAAGGMDLAKASDLATDACSALGLGIKDMDELMDDMARASQKSNMSVSQVGEAILVCAGASSNFGMDLTALNTNLGVLANNGIKGAEGGTHLRNILLSLSSPTGTAIACLDKLNVTTSNADGSFRDLNDIMKDLNSALGSLSDAEKADYLTGIFNKTDIAAVNALLKGCGEEYENLAKEISNSGGAASDMAETMINNLNGQITILKSSLEGVGIQIYESLQDPLKGAVSRVQELVTGFSEAFSKGGIGGAISYVAEQIPKIGKEITAGITQIAPDFINGFNTVIISVADAIVQSLPAAINGLLPPFLDGFSGLVSGIIAQIPALVPPLLDGGVMLFMSLIDALNSVIAQLTPMLPKIITQVVDTIKNGLPKLIEGAAKFFAGLLTALAEVAPALISSVVSLIPVIVSSVLDNIPLLIDAGLKLFVALVGALPDIITQIVAALPEIITSVLAAITESIPLIITAGVELFVALIRELPAIIAAIVAAVPEIIEALKTGFGEYYSSMAGVGLNLISSIGEGLMNGISAVKDKIKSAGEAIIGAFKEKFGIASPSKVMKKEIGENLAAGVGEGLADGMGRVIGSLDGVCDEIGTKFKKIVAEEEKAYKDAQKALETEYNGKIDILKKELKAQKNATDEIKASYNDRIKALKNELAARKEALSEEKKASVERINSIKASLLEEVKAYSSSLSEIKKNYTKAMEDVQKEISSLSVKFTGSMEDMFTFDTDESGNIISARLTDKISKATEQVKEYQKLIDWLREKGIDEAMIEDLSKMSVDKGIAVAKYYSTLSAEQLKNVSANWNTLGQASEELSGSMLKSKTDAVIKECVDSINELAKSEQWVNLGVSIAGGIGQGLTGALKNVVSNIFRSITSGTDINLFGLTSAVASAGAQGGGTVINFKQYNSSPKALSPADTYRQTRDGLTLANSMR